MSRALVWTGCLILAVILGVTAMSLASRGHSVTLPLDDAYIYLQYARTAVAGHFGEYFPGDGRSAGATSPLWLISSIGIGGILTITGNSLAENFPAAILILSTLITAVAMEGGRDVIGDVEFFVPKGETRFRESAILIPTEATRTAVAGELPIRVEGSGYRAFHWWILHPDTGDPQP